MCCNKNNKMCSQNQPERVEFVSSVGLEFVQQLVDAARGGLYESVGKILSLAVFKSPAAKQMAETIIGLVAENEYLKRVLGRPPDVPAPVIKEHNFELAFGPDSAYRLVVPLESADHRRRLAKQLRAVAEQLETSAAPQQTEFPFVSDYISAAP